MSHTLQVNNISLINLLSYGSEQPLPTSLDLRAGPLELALVDGQLRRIRLGQHEVLWRVYFAARDPAWRTAANAITIIGQDITPDSFYISYRAKVRLDELRLDLMATLYGTSEGVVSFGIEALTLNDFFSNRVGLCVLHPASCAGTVCSITHSDGSIERGHFPTLVAPHQPFTAIKAITHVIKRGVQAQVELEGAVFEMEDQRNWSDASFKTYSGQLTPARPLPLYYAAGTRIYQRVTLQLVGTTPISARRTPRHTTLTLDETRAHPLPSLGLGLPGRYLPASKTDLQALSTLNVQHFRLEIDLSNPHSLQALRHLGQSALPLEIALALSSYEKELTELDRLVSECKPKIIRWLVYGVLNAELGQVCARLRQLTPGVPIASGSAENLAELNRVHPDVAVLDQVCFALNPQVHQTDNDTLVENLGSQRAVVATARAIAGNKPLVISPFSLKPRLVSEAHGVKRMPTADEVATLADPRYTSLLGASWLALTLTNLSATGGVASITCYDALGWNGVMESAALPAFSSRWPELSNTVYPSYHVVTWLGKWSGGEVLPVTSSDHLKVGALAVRRNGKCGILVCNMTGVQQQVRIHLPENCWHMKTLDPGNVLMSLSQRDYLAQLSNEAITLHSGKFDSNLAPYGLVFLEGNC
jgi:hypothetical protein